MNSYSYRVEQASQTACHVVVAGLLASQLFGVASLPVANEAENVSLGESPYATHASPSSLGQLSTIVSGRFDDPNTSLALEAVTDFYSKLLEQQEPLGESFESVLRESLWDLYEA